jgi:predicted ABC-type ATPase
LNRKIRNLIEQLGEAIHETVAESDQIAGVVRNIRAEGFEVMLMLEATIGLNEAETDAAEKVEPEVPGAGPFTAQDLHFLRSLRIRLTDETGNAEAAD